MTADNVSSISASDLYFVPGSGAAPAIVSAHDIHDAALDQLATIDRGADTSRPDLTPQCEGLLAISQAIFPMTTRC